MSIFPCCSLIHRRIQIQGYISRRSFILMTLWLSLWEYLIIFIFGFSGVVENECCYGNYFCYFSCWHLGDNFMSSFCSSCEPQYKNPYRSLLWVKLNLLSDCRLGLFRMNSSGHWEQYFIHKVLVLCREYTRKYELKERFSKLEFWF